MGIQKMSASHAPSKAIRSQRVKKAGTSLALAAAVALGGIALATPAHAEDYTPLPISVALITKPTENSWRAVWFSGWSRAYDACREWYKGAYEEDVKSVRLLGYSQLANPNEYHSIWECRLTP